MRHTAARARCALGIEALRLVPGHWNDRPGEEGREGRVTLGRQEEAMVWYRRAADAGNGDALNALGCCAELGLGGIARDWDHAWECYQLASSAGCRAAEDNLRELESQLHRRAVAAGAAFGPPPPMRDLATAASHGEYEPYPDLSELPDPLQPGAHAQLISRAAEQAVQGTTSPRAPPPTAPITLQKGPALVEAATWSDAAGRAAQHVILAAAHEDEEDADEDDARAEHHEHSHIPEGAGHHAADIDAGSAGGGAGSNSLVSSVPDSEGGSGASGSGQGSTQTPSQDTRRVVGPTHAGIAAHEEALRADETAGGSPQGGVPEHGSRASQPDARGADPDDRFPGKAAPAAGTGHSTPASDGGAVRSAHSKAGPTVEPALSSELEEEEPEEQGKRGSRRSNDEQAASTVSRAMKHGRAEIHGEEQQGRESPEVAQSARAPQRGHMSPEAQTAAAAGERASRSPPGTSLKEGPEDEGKPEGAAGLQQASQGSGPQQVEATKDTVARMESREKHLNVTSVTQDDFMSPPMFDEDGDSEDLEVTDMTDEDDDMDAEEESGIM
ncbi:hypothetical protein CYMTET_21963 [Cymbomonas tetramitiformis]|uniref:Uncharacterized protein n=1 Tax=Cymbomonas tetramitiformis TaxID=36881 RepID=A0AAE0L2R8_9CHLO|nr:hypothetical protein CYMTET_21963 [Cymbomonas tetramitiformis]